MVRTSWQYILRAFKWARKYGLRVLIDLHSAPGSQNGTFDFPFSSPSRSRPCEPDLIGCHRHSKLSFSRACSFQSLWKEGHHQLFEWSYGTRERSADPQLHPNLHRILYPAGIHQPHSDVRYPKRGRCRDDRSRDFDILVRRHFCIRFRDSVNPLFN